MRIIEIKKVEDCFDGSSVYRYWFDQVWTRQVIISLRAMGDVDYFPDFPRPFFRLCGNGGFQVKGVEGDDNCQVILPHKQRDSVKEAFERHLAELS